MCDSSPYSYKPEVSGETALFHYQKNIFPQEYATEIKHWLDNIELKSGKCISGKEVPRLQLWFQERNKYFCEVWKYRYPRWESEPYPDILSSFQTKIIDITRDVINGHPEFTFPEFTYLIVLSRSFLSRIFLSRYSFPDFFFPDSELLAVSEQEESFPDRILEFS